MEGLFEKAVRSARGIEVRRGAAMNTEDKNLTARSLLSSKILKLQRIFGFFDRAVAIRVLGTVVACLQKKHDSEVERERCHRLIGSILRQVLALYPLDEDIFRMLLKWSAIAPSDDADMAWIRHLGRIQRKAAPHWKREHSNFVSKWSNDPEGFTRVLEDTSNPLVLYEAVWRAWESGAWDLCKRGAERFLSTPYAPFVSAMFGWASLGAGDLEQAQRFSNVAHPSFLKSNLMAELSLRAGNTEETRRWWEDSVRREPFQPWVYYRLWELEQARPSEALLEGKRIFIFIYTFNKRQEVLYTLSSLLASKIGSARIVLLNNGSTLFSPEELEAEVRNVAKGYSVSIIHLPVNIGAPAARNWLWYLPEARSADYVAYLDDDVLVPEDWLLAYLQDFEIFPDAVVVGPKVRNPGSVATIQYVYRFFQKEEKLKIHFTSPAPFSFDLGQYSFRRPCVSVMGCCHLFHRGRWNRLGLPDFDICFAPSQVDDIEHDLQIWKHGGGVLYDGRVEVLHLQKSGRAYTRSLASWSHVWGNHMKMEAKFTTEEIDAINRAVEKVDDAFFRTVCNSYRMNFPKEWDDGDK